MDLAEIAPILEEIIKQTLEEKRYKFGFAKFQGTSNKVASGKLRDSVKVTASNNMSGIEVLKVVMEDYYQWVQSGRLPGKGFVPVKALETWIKQRGLQGRDKKGRFITRKSFAFAIARNINKFGIRPSNFLDISIETIMNDERITNLIEGASFEELIDLIEGI